MHASMKRGHVPGSGKLHLAHRSRRSSSRLSRLILAASGLLTWTELDAHAGGPAFLVKDINTIQSTAPARLTSFDGKIFFVVYDTHAGPGLWRSDGTAEGTARIKAGVVGQLAPTDGALFFLVRSDSDDGDELWSIDGNETAVHLRTFPDFSAVGEFTEVGGTLFFAANFELWKSDGTVAGTLPPLRTFPMRQPHVDNLTNVNGTLFFVDFDGTYYELWKSDGTAAGTVPLTNFHKEFYDGNPFELTAVDETLFFTYRVQDPRPDHTELWRSDGTVSGTARIDTQVAIGALTNVDGTAFFVAVDGSGTTGVWKSDGTAAGTVRVTDFPPLASGGCADGAWDRCGLTAANGTLFFGADDGTGVALWRSDGMPAGTRLVRYVSVLSDSLVDSGGTLYFLADNGNSGIELWRSDGSEGDTALVKDIQRGHASDLIDVDGTLFFVADDGSTGHEIWKSDGTEAGTVRVTDILHDTHGSNPTDLTDVNGTLVFVADDGHAGAKLWRSDGTSAGTRLVKDIGPVDGTPTEVSGTLFFAADDGSNGFELWRSDGTQSGTVLVKDVNPGEDGSYPSHLTEAGGTLLFWADDGSHGHELWKSDGTPAGTVLVKDIYAGSGGSSFPPSLCVPVCFLSDWEPTEVGGTLFFLAYDGSVGDGSIPLWKTDGTAAGTVRVKDIDLGLGRIVYRFDLVDVDGTLFLVFLRYPGGFGEPARLSENGSASSLSTPAYVIWKSDGTDTGTVPVADIPVWDGNPGPRPASANGTLFLFSNHQLWRSDGTAAGTVPVGDLGPNSAVSNPTNLEGALVFIVSDASGVTALWRSDGTETGTVLVKQLPGGLPLSGTLTNIDGLLLFAVGGEIWQSDGTEAGTRRIQDLGPVAAPPSSFTLAGGRVFFSADAGGTGPELWALPLATSCRGDCSGDGAVTISDLITAVNIALGRVPLSACQSLDADDGGSLTVDEIVAAVNEVLHGCT